MATFRCKLLLLLCAAVASASAPNPVHWRRVNAETLRHFTALLRIDTSNPPGTETEAAKYLAGVLEREGIPVKLLALDPARANLVARIKGNGSAPASPAGPERFEIRAPLYLSLADCAPGSR